MTPRQRSISARPADAAVARPPMVMRRLQLAGLVVLTAAALYVGGAHAQTSDPSGTTPAAAEPTAPAQIQGPPVPAAAPIPPAVSTTPPASAAVPAAPAAPRYSAAQVTQMFDYMDRDKDGFLSREEASGFRGVARHFDEADVNKDGRLSREEFEKAMNQVK